MNIKKKMPKFISLLLSFAMAFSNVIPAYAMEITNSDSETVIDGENIGAEESNFEDIKVTYTQSSSFFVTIPKTIALDGWKQSTYSVKVEGDIEAEQCVYVAPVDGISSTEDIDFYMEDQASKNKKANVVATVTQNKQHWNSAEVTDGYAQTDNLVNAPDLTAGTWKGIFQIEIKLESHVTHTHNYIETITKEATCTEDGEKTYTCECGDSYTEVIPAGHHYGDDDKCTECGEFNPNHTHNYVDNTNLISWENTSNGSYAFIQNGSKWTSNNKAVKPSTATSTWTITLDDDTEYSLKYKVSSEAKYDKLTITLDSTKIADAISGAGNEITYTTTLTAGTHTLVATYAKDNSRDENDDCAYVILKDIVESNHKCTICGNKEAHDYVEQIEAATCTEDGSKTTTCSVCGKVDTTTIVIPATGHNYGEYTIIKEATCTEEGSKQRTCSVCGYVDIVTIPVNHNYVDGTCTICGKEVDPYEIAPTTAYINWDYTLDDINNIITLNYYKGSETNVIVYANYAIGDKTYKTQLASNPSNIYSSKYMFNGYASSNCQNILSIVFSKDINTSNITNLSCMFQKCSKLRSISNLKYLDISNVTNMNYIFAECPSLTSLDLSGWDTSNVTSMYWMFGNCDQLSQIIGLETFNTSNVTNMGYMFSYCKKLSSLNLTSFDTSNVTNMWAMFQYCEALYSLDLTSFNIQNVDTLQAMFYNSKSLSKVLVSRDKWVVKSGCSTSSMFDGCATSSVTYK